MDPLGTLFVLAAAVMWALIGAFSKALLAQGLGPMEIAFWRAALAGVMFVAHAAVVGKLRLRFTELPALLAFGFLGVTIFYGAYQVAVRDVGMALASVLLYTAPAWVALLSWRLLGEPMTRTKAACVGLTVAGVACISLGDLLAGGGPAKLNLPGLAAGVVSGMTYALYYVFGKRFIGRGLATPTIFAYALPAGSIMMTPVVDFAPKSAYAWTLLVAMAAISSYGAFSAHYAGLRRLEATRASVIATLEPVVAAIFARLLFGEALSAAGYAGGAMVIAAALAIVSVR